MLSQNIYGNNPVNHVTERNCKDTENLIFQNILSTIINYISRVICNQFILTKDH